MITAEKIRYHSLAIEDLRIAPGITSLIGPNGSGKTTLLKLFAGIAVPESGMVRIDGIPPRNVEIGWLNEFPDRNILFGSVTDEIASPLRFRHLPCPIIEERVREMMESAALRHLETRPVHTLSGGEKVLVALAAAIVIRPQVLVLDEYDSHLDTNSALAIETIIRKEKIPRVVHCTQDMDTAARADMVIFLEQGAVRYAGTPEEVFESLEGSAYYPISWRCRS